MLSVFIITYLLQMPDIPVILCNGAVRREVTGFCNIYSHFLCKGHAILIVGIGLFSGFHIGIEVREGHEPVCCLVSYDQDEL